ncbi:hypothetical protein ACPA9J_09820 [Pseudomonas aeruginosa]
MILLAQLRFRKTSARLSATSCTLLACGCTPVSLLPGAGVPGDGGGADGLLRGHPHRPLTSARRSSCC